MCIYLYHIPFIYPLSHIPWFAESTITSYSLCDCGYINNFKNKGNKIKYNKKKNDENKRNTRKRHQTATIHFCANGKGGKSASLL